MKHPNTMYSKTITQIIPMGDSGSEDIHAEMVAGAG